MNNYTKNERWLLQPSEQYPVVELTILEVSPSGQKYKCYIGSGARIGAVEWLAIGNWKQVEQLPASDEITEPVPAKQD